MSLHPSIEIVPASAPFDAEERRLLNAFFLDLIAKTLPPELPAAAADEAEDLPWKDPAMEIGERMTLADGRPIGQRMMAAVAQQDCGQCGYNCATYPKAIVEQAEPRLNLCVPGGKATARMLKALVEEMGGGVIGPDEVAAKAAVTRPESADARPGYSRDNPALARLIGRRRLNGAASEKTTMHIEMDLSGSGIDYVVGDSLGVFAPNPPDLVDAILAAIDAPADFPIAGRSLRDVLIEDMALGLAPDSLFEFISYLTGGERRKKAKALAMGEDPDGDAETLDVLAALEKFPGIRPDPEAFIEVLEPIQPRLYSISSSPKTRSGIVTLTVDVVGYELAGRYRHGVASSHLGHRHDEGGALKVYLQKAHGFALPEDHGTPIVMIGPGTGVAPFRAFVEERRAVGATGKAWLFYGHQRAVTDFFYAEEWHDHLASGTLTELSLAWSRDGAEKVYVQHVMRERGADLYEWIVAGAHVYVCGDAKRMARDVEMALIDIVANHGGHDPETARGIVQAMKKAGRYQTDVY